MAKRYALSKATLAAWAKLEVALTKAQDALTDERDEQRGRFEEATERWLESERGEAVGEYLDRLDEIVDGIETFRGDCVDTIEEAAESQGM